MHPGTGPFGPKSNSTWPSLSSSSTSTSQPLRPLRPVSSGQALFPPDDADSGSTSSLSPLSGPPVPGHVKRACQECQRRKTKCSGQRPVCAGCARRRVPCHYDTVDADETPIRALKRKHEAATRAKTTYEELLSCLVSVPEADSLALLHRIRAGGDVDSVLRLVRDGDLPSQLLLSPETYIRYAFPHVSHMPYSLQIPTNEYLHSAVYRASLSLPTSTRPPLQLAPLTSPVATAAPPVAGQYPPPYLTPYSAASIASPPLWSARSSVWTNVITDDTLFQRLLNSYFLHAHPDLPCVQKDDFLHDLASGKKRFCSPALVNAILAAACHCHSGLAHAGQFWNPDYLGYKLLAEAKRLYELEMIDGANELVNIQTTFVFNIVNNYQGMDVIGCSWLSRLLKMATEAELFGTNEHIEDTRMRRSRQFTAWAIFNWQFLGSLYFMRSPPLQTPPKSPLPPLQENSAWYGEFRLQYPQSHQVFPMGFPDLFRAASELRVMLNQAAVDFFDGMESPQGLSAAQALQVIEDLETWRRGLDGPLSAENIVLPGHFRVHIEYHAFLYSLPTLLSESALQSDAITTIRAAAHEARIRFETLMRLFHLRHSMEASQGIMTYFCTVLATATAQEMATTEEGQQSDRPLPPIAESRHPGHPPAPSLELDRQVQKSTLLIGTTGLYHQGRSYHMGKVLYQVIRAQLPSDAASVIDAHIPSRADGDGNADLVADHARSQFPMPFGARRMLKRDIDLARVENIISQQYSNMSLDEPSADVDEDNDDNNNDGDSNDNNDDNDGASGDGEEEDGVYHFRRTGLHQEDEEPSPMRSDVGSATSLGFPL